MFMSMSVCIMVVGELGKKGSEREQKGDGRVERSKDKIRAKHRDVSKRKNKGRTEKEREVGVLLSGCFNTPFIGQGSNPGLCVYLGGCIFEWSFLRADSDAKTARGGCACLICGLG